MDPPTVHTIRLLYIQGYNGFPLVRSPRMDRDFTIVVKISFIILFKKPYGSILGFTSL